MAASQGGLGRILDTMVFLEAVHFRDQLGMRQVRQFRGFIRMATYLLTGAMNHIILLVHIR